MASTIFIVGAARTPIGAHLGTLAPLNAPALGAVAVRAALTRGRVAPESVDAVLMGQVLTAGVGQAPARQVALGAGVRQSAPCTTVGKVCGSGLEAILLGAQALASGNADVIVAGGMESMSNVPYYLPKARSGLRLGHGEVQDGLILDGLWDPYGQLHMGNFGDRCAAHFKLSRAAQDAFAAQSYTRAQRAIEQGYFVDEIAPVPVPQSKGEPTLVKVDEGPGRANLEKLPKLRPAFDPEGTVTAGNASSLNDGAAAVVLATEAAIARNGLTPLARIVAHAGHAQAPEWFTTAPIEASRRALERAKLSVTDIDAWEINEAFACVTLACMQELRTDPEKVNVWGGAVALGHPIGATGARLVVTLLSVLKQRQAKRGVATLCIGGGEGLALILERV
jgi:acetyl-CoA C-acetyltransferase